MLYGVDFEQYCSCGWGHHALAAAQKLQREHSWEVGDIASMRVEGHHWTAGLHTTHPTIAEEAQLSVK